MCIVFCNFVDSLLNVIRHGFVGDGVVVNVNVEGVLEVEFPTFAMAVEVPAVEIPVMEILADKSPPLSNFLKKTENNLPQIFDFPVIGGAGDLFPGIFTAGISTGGISTAGISTAKISKAGNTNARNLSSHTRPINVHNSNANNITLKDIQQTINKIIKKPLNYNIIMHATYQLQQTYKIKKTMYNSTDIIIDIMTNDARQTNYRQQPTTDH